MSARASPLQVLHDVTVHDQCEQLSWAEKGTHLQAPRKTQIRQAKRTHGSLCKMPSGAWQTPVSRAPLL